MGRAPSRFSGRFLTWFKFFRISDVSKGVKLPTQKGWATQSRDVTKSSSSIDSARNSWESGCGLSTDQHVRMGNIVHLSKVGHPRGQNVIRGVITQYFRRNSSMFCVLDVFSSMYFSIVFSMFFSSIVIVVMFLSMFRFSMCFTCFFDVCFYMFSQPLLPLSSSRRT